MSSLSVFFSENAANNETIKYVASSRFVENGQPVEWEIQGVTSEADEQIRKDCTKRVQVPGKKNVYTPEVDYNQYLGKLAAKCTIFPNLNDKDLQDSYDAMSSDSLLKSMLKPGEYAEYLKKIQEINGFDMSMDERVEEAKN